MSIFMNMDSLNIKAAFRIDCPLSHSLAARKTISFGDLLPFPVFHVNQLSVGIKT